MQVSKIRFHGVTTILVDNNEVISVFPFRRENGDIEIALNITSKCIYRYHKIPLEIPFKKFERMLISFLKSNGYDFKRVAFSAVKCNFTVTFNDGYWMRIKSDFNDLTIYFNSENNFLEISKGMHLAFWTKEIMKWRRIAQ